MKTRLLWMVCVTCVACDDQSVPAGAADATADTAALGDGRVADGASRDGPGPDAPPEHPDDANVDAVNMPDVGIDIDAVNMPDAANVDAVNMPEVGIDVDAVNMPEVGIDVDAVNMPDVGVDVDAVNMPDVGVDVDAVNMRDVGIDVDAVNMPDVGVDVDAVNMPDAGPDSASDVDVDAVDMELEPEPLASAIAAVVDGWVEVFVDRGAPAGGDGTERAPFATVVEALAATEGAAFVHVVGHHPEAVDAEAPLALVGGSVGAVRSGHALVLDGAAAGSVEATGPSLILHRAEVLGLTRIVGVATAEVVDSVLDEVEVRGAAVAVRASRTAAFDADFDPADDECARSAVCPFSAFVYLEDAEVAGLDLRYAAYGVNRSVITGGMRSRQGFGRMFGDSVSRDAAGPCVRTESGRGSFEGARVEACGGGGFDVQRLFVGDGRLRFPDPAWADNAVGWRFPHPSGWALDPRAFIELPRGEWRTLPRGEWREGDRLPRGEWFPPPDFLPRGEWFPNPGALPGALRPDAELAAPDLDLHLWARQELRGLDASANRGFGLRLSGHATLVVDARVSGTGLRDPEPMQAAGRDDGWSLRPLVGAPRLGPGRVDLPGDAIPPRGRAAGVVVLQRSALPLSLPESSAVALSRLIDVESSDNAGAGFVMAGAALVDDDGAYAARKLLVDGARAVANGGPGLLVHESAVEIRAASVLDAGVAGLWSVGSFTDVSGSLFAATVGDGIVLQGSDRWAGDAHVGMRDSRAIGSDRWGLLVYADCDLFSADLVFEAGALADNGAGEAAVVGDAPCVNVAGAALLPEALAPPDPALDLLGCEGAAPVGDLVCDGLDDDCDGAADEDYVSRDARCGVGRCERDATTVCVAGQEQIDCPPPPAAPDATCDGVDDDCDERLDEDVGPLDTACGVGACARDGVIACVAGGFEDQCVAGDPADEACNDVDDDCDTVVDEGTPLVGLRTISEPEDPHSDHRVAWNGGGYGLFWRDSRNDDPAFPLLYELFFARLDPNGVRVLGGRAVPDTNLSGVHLARWTGAGYDVLWRPNPSGLVLSKLSAAGERLMPDRRIDDQAQRASVVWTGDHYAIYYQRAGSGHGYFMTADGDGEPIIAAARRRNVPTNANPALVYNPARDEYAALVRAAFNEISLVRLDADGAEVGTTRIHGPVDGCCLSPAIVDTGERYAMVFSDAADAWLAFADYDGQPDGPAQRLNLVGLTGGGTNLVWTGDELGVCWRDDRGVPGRALLRFRRFSPAGAPTGPVAALSEDLSVSRPDLHWTGAEYVAVWTHQANIEPIFLNHGLFGCPP